MSTAASFGLWIICLTAGGDPTVIPMPTAGAHPAPAATVSAPPVEVEATAPSCTHTDARAGNPKCISKCARFPYDRGYCAGWVGGGGGGVCRPGDPPTLEEGTWGTDYQGFYPARRVFLRWNHGRRYQGGTGAYASEAGPRLPQPPILRKL